MIIVSLCIDNIVRFIGRLIFFYVLTLAYMILLWLYRNILFPYIRKKKVTICNILFILNVQMTQYHCRYAGITKYKHPMRVAK